MSLPSTVVKIGGSLLELTDLAARLRGLFSLLDADGSSPGVGLVVGGGPAADLVRRWDADESLSAEDAHWLAIRAMRLTERLVQARLPEAVVAESLAAARVALRSGRIVLLAMEPLLAEGRHDGIEIPLSSWEVTSDTLAAWAARRLGSRRLVMVKSIEAPRGGLRAASAAGAVDPQFPRAAAGLDLSWVNLRAERPEIVGALSE